MTVGWALFGGGAGEVSFVVDRKQLGDQRSFTWLGRAKHVGVDTGLLLCRGMQFLLKKRLDDASSGGEFPIAALRANASTLDGQSLVHDRASSSNELQVGDGAATWGLVGGGGEGAQSGGRGLLQEGTDALGLAKESLHDYRLQCQNSRVGSRQNRMRRVGKRVSEGGSGGRERGMNGI